MQTEMMVLSVNRWSFTDETSGEIRDGVTVKMVDVTPKNEKDKIGYEVIQTNVKSEEWPRFQKGAGVYKCQLDTVALAKQRAGARFHTFEFVRSLVLNGK